MKISNRLLIIAVLFVTCLLTANIIGSKVFSIGSIALPAAVIVFPFSYIFGDVLTEVYGYKQARRIIWLGFLCNLIFVFFAWVGQLLPPAPFWANQTAYEAILGYTPRLLAASFAGYLVGEFANSFVLARMKVFTKGRWLWSRTIGSTIVGEGLDTVIFIFGAFYGTPVFAPVLILNHWVAKVGIEILFTPVTYKAVNYLKRTEGIDTYDIQTNFNPLAFFDRRTKPEVK
ncbi:MAG: queuosine precursor transporter [Dehalococcoidales bacterium]|nr:queuosine precursor transporter [Dehalococcoidales bacterium]